MTGPDQWKFPPRPSQTVLVVSLIIALYGGIRLNAPIAGLGLFAALGSAFFGRMRRKFKGGGGAVGGLELPTLEGELVDPVDDAPAKPKHAPESHPDRLPPPSQGSRLRAPDKEPGSD
jgi:hypothetical protein